MCIFSPNGYGGCKTMYVTNGTKNLIDNVQSHWRIAYYFTSKTQQQFTTRDEFIIFGSHNITHKLCGREIFIHVPMIR